MSGRLVSCIWSRLTYSCRPRLLDRTSFTRFVTPVLGRDAVLARNYATSEPATGYRFSKSHEWTSLDGTKATIGVTNYAQDKLGDVVYVELPVVGQELEEDDVFGVLESVKAASDLYSPLSGTVVDVNSQLSDSPELINKEPYAEGWLMKLELKDTSEYDQLMSQEEYMKFLEEEDS
ncbi:glycine cleavage system H protein-like [Dysidea avara]|uniref:glycine cleavage system H protein-like n=1 Tax=Dysidea avara TaxID=196820 RepID=UPI00332355EB